MKDSQIENKTCFNCGQIGFTCGECIKRSEWIPKKENNDEYATTWECGGGEAIEQMN